MEEIENWLKDKLIKTGGTLFKNVQKEDSNFFFAITLDDKEHLNLESEDFICLVITESENGKRKLLLKVDESHFDYLESLESKTEK